MLVKLSFLWLRKRVGKLEISGSKGNGVILNLIRLEHFKAK